MRRPVRNGTLTGCGIGVELPHGRVIPVFHLDSLTIAKNGMGVDASGLQHPGVPPAVASTIARSKIERNSGWGIAAEYYRLTVTDTSITRNGGYGAFLFETPGVFERNDISNNGNTGLRTKFRPVTLIENRLNGNGGAGFSLENHELDPLASSHLRNNEANNNAGLGLSVQAVLDLPWEGFDGGGNVAKNNGDDDECAVYWQNPPIPTPELLVCVRKATKG